MLKYSQETKKSPAEIKQQETTMTIAKERFGRKNGIRYSDMPEYHAWDNMCSRVLNPKNPRYNHYGQRNIKICDRWREKRGFLNFLDDLGLKPTPQHSLNRINNDGDYTPENCEWATAHAQAINKRSLVNKSGYKGVMWNPPTNSYRVKLNSQGKVYHIGMYKDIEQAAIAYDCAVIQLHEGKAIMHYL